MKTLRAGRRQSWWRNPIRVGGLLIVALVMAGVCAEAIQASSSSKAAALRPAVDPAKIMPPWKGTGCQWVRPENQHPGDKLPRPTQCWTMKYDDRVATVEFQAEAVDSDATYPVSYYVENYRDGLYTPSYPRHNGERFSINLRAGDAVMIDRGKMNVVSTTYGPLLDVQPTPEWPTVPRLGDRCEIVTPAIGDKPCWWVPPGHPSVNLAVWARGTSPDWLGGDTDYRIKNVDGLEGSGSIRYGDEKALTLRPGDTLSLKGGLDFDYKHSLTAVAVAPY